MNELISNIGLGLCVNGSYALLNGTVELQPYLITILSIYIMYKAIQRDKEQK